MNRGECDLCHEEPRDLVDLYDLEEGDETPVQWCERCVNDLYHQARSGGYRAQARCERFGLDWRGL